MLSCPRKGATMPHQLNPVDLALVSIPAPVKGATECGTDGDRGHIVSIPAPVKGATTSLLWFGTE